MQARSAATVEAILSAATQILLKGGYDKASTNKIADLAGVSIGSLYEYFPGKEAIFAQVRRQEDKRLFDLVMSQEIPRTVKSLIKLHVTTYLEFVRSNLDLHAALINDVPEFALEENEFAYYTDYVPWTFEFLKNHQDELRPALDLEEVTDFITRVVRATINNYVLYDPDALKNTVVENLLIELLERFMFKL